METITENNLNDILNKEIYISYQDLNKFMDSDTIYDYIKHISENSEFDVIN